MKSLLAGRYALRAPIGKGAMGVVWQAWDSRNNVGVALKTLRKVDPDGVYRLKQEFRARADIAHPNLVSLYELVADGDEWFLTMELIDGMPFLDWIRGENWEPAARSTSSATLDPASYATPLGATTYRGGTPAPAAEWTPEEAPDRREAPAQQTPNDRRRGTTPDDLDRLRDAFRQLAEGVAALHQADRLHRDLKPANVLVTREGRVVLVDFGLAAELHSGETRAERGMAGTAAYMPPEQAMAAPLTPASDWYAVGVMLFEALTGIRPFEGSIARIIADKQTRAAPFPADHSEGVPDDLNGLARQLMARSTQERPQTERILEVLGAGVARTFAPRVLVGRSRHLRRLERSWKRAQRGETSVVCLRGPSGMGKSVLVDRFLETLDAPVLRGRCFERELVPYNAFDDLVDDLAKALLERGDDFQLPEGAGALRRVFPGLDRVARIEAVPLPADADAQEIRHRAFAALGELLRSLSPVVVNLDDVQWGDQDSLRLLTALISARPPILVILSYRDGEQTPFLTGLPAALEGSDPVEIEVGTLSPRESLDYALQQLGDRNDPELARSIADESGGNPLFVEELSRRARSGPAQSLDALIAERVDALPADQRHVARLVAVAGRPIPIRAIAAAADIEEPRPILDLLRSANLVRTSADRVEPFHDRVRESVSERLDEAIRVAHHSRLARALEDEDPQDPEALYRHWEGAREPERAAPWAVRAAERAITALAFDRAAAQFRAALELGHWTPEEAGDLWARAAEALSLSGRSRDAGEAWIRAADGCPDPTASLDRSRQAAEAFLEGGDSDRGLELADQVLRSVGLSAARHPRQAVLPLLWLRARMWWRGLEPSPPGPISEADAFRMRVYHSMSRGFALIDFIQSESFTYRHLLAALDAGDPLRSAQGLTALAATLGAGSPSDRAKVPGLLERSEKLRDDTPDALANLQMSHSMIAFADGDFEATTRWADQATHTLSTQCRGMQFELTSTRLFACWGLLFSGHLSALSDRLPGLIRQAHERGNLRFLATAETELHSAVALAQDNPDDAREVLEACVSRLAGRDTFQLPQQSEMLGRSQIHAYCGEVDACYAMMEATWPRLNRSLMLHNRFIRLEGWLLRARTALAYHRAHPEHGASLALARTSLKHAAKDATPWALAVGRHTRATLLELTGEPVAAIAELRGAVADLETHGMHLHANAARRRLGTLLQGDEGELLTRVADSWFASQGVVAPVAMTRMCLGS